MILTYTILIANKNAISAEKSAEAASTQANFLLHKEKPQIVIRSIGLHQGSIRKYPNDVHAPIPNSPLRVDIAFANFGTTAAFDIFVTAEPHIGVDLPVERPRLQQPHPDIPGALLPPVGVTGEKIPTVGLFLEIKMISDEEAERIRKKQSFFFVYGLAQYSDLLGTMRETGFAFVLDVSKDPAMGNFDGAKRKEPYNYYK